MTRTVAFFMAIGDEYRKKMKFWLNNSVSSFKKWHPDIEVKVLVDSDFKEFTWNEDLGPLRIQAVKKLFAEGYSRVIQIGLDTITTGRMTELLEDTTTPIVAVYEGSCSTHTELTDNIVYYNPFRCVFEVQHISTDTLLFNHVCGIEKWFETTKKYPEINDYQALNMLNKEIPGFIKIVNFPYFISQVTYSLPALGAIGSSCYRDDGLYFGFDGPKISDILPTKSFVLRGDIMYNHEGKRVKNMHFCSDIKYIPFHKMFNQDVLDFFTEHCDCDLTIEFPEPRT
jgi:hypothetical protein